MMEKIVAIIEARMTSSRLPGKVLKTYLGIPNLEHIVNRLRNSLAIDEIVVATTVNSDDEAIVELCKKINCKYFRGSEDDVLLRVLEAAKSVEATHIVEITADCPVIDWRIIDKIVCEYFKIDCDYASNIIERTFPRGLDVQVFSVNVLEKVNSLTRSPIDHEHVSLYIYTHPEMFKLHNIIADKDLRYPEYGITLDNQKDYELISEIYRRLYPINVDFSGNDVIKLILSDGKLKELALDEHRKNPFEEQRKWLEENQ